MIFVRAAGSLDASAMADLLNEVIAEGGTTAMTDPVSRQALIDRMSFHAGRNSWVLAEDNNGEVLGFQWIEPKNGLPEDACDIATFARVGRVRLGCGTKMFEETRKRAKALGYSWINATIRADNEGGLAYYQSRGFETYSTKEGVALGNGMIVDRISKRYGL